MVSFLQIPRNLFGGAGLQELSSSLDIRATPTFFFLKDGQQIDKLVGANKLELLKKIPAALDSAKQS